MSIVTRSAGSTCFPVCVSIWWILRIHLLASHLSSSTWAICHMSFPLCSSTIPFHLLPLTLLHKHLSNASMLTPPPLPMYYWLQKLPRQILLTGIDALAPSSALATMYSCRPSTGTAIFTPWILHGSQSSCHGMMAPTPSSEHIQRSLLTYYSFPTPIIPFLLFIPAYSTLF